MKKFLSTALNLALFHSMLVSAALAAEFTVPAKDIHSAITVAPLTRSNNSELGALRRAILSMSWIDGRSVRHASYTCQTIEECQKLKELISNAKKLNTNLILVTNSDSLGSDIVSIERDLTAKEKKALDEREAKAAEAQLSLDIQQQPLICPGGNVSNQLLMYFANLYQRAKNYPNLLHKVMRPELVLKRDVVIFDGEALQIALNGRLYIEFKTQSPQDKFLLKKGTILRFNSVKIQPRYYNYHEKSISLEVVVDGKAIQNPGFTADLSFDSSNNYNPVEVFNEGLKNGINFKFVSTEERCKPQTVRNIEATSSSSQNNSSATNAM